MSYMMNELCSGCGACINICPSNALSWTIDSDGFYIPKSDKEKCNSCNACMRICPVLNPKYPNNPNPACYAVMADDDIRYKSSSGGAFSLIAMDFLERGGRVCGAAWNEDFTVSHIIIDKVADLPKLQKSKYMQSFMGDIYKQTVPFLDEGKPFLFVGCPCQIAGLNEVLPRTYENLWTIDLLCGKQESPKHFKKYLDENFGKNNIVSYQFRSKPLGWRPDMSKVEMKKGQTLFQDKTNDPYLIFQFAASHLSMGCFCANCRFSRYPRQGDITLGDFWGIKGDKSLDDGKGTSVLLINNERGTKLKEVAESRAILFKETPLHRLGGNGQKKKKLWTLFNERFFELFKYLGFNKALDFSVNEKYDIGFLCEANALEYGAALSYFSLYKALTLMGFETLVIDKTASGGG